LAVAWLAPQALPPLHASVIRDCLPAALLLMAYWQGGQFFIKPDVALQRELERLDERFVSPALTALARHRLAGVVVTYFELAYLLCYVTVPGALGILYALRQARHADEFWSIVLPASYICYALLPFFQTLPPRTLAGRELLPPGPVRRFNLLVLRHGSIQVNTFPSAHVAASLACSLALLTIAPWAGLAMLWVAMSIAAGAVIGRYHYLADAITGAAVAVAVLLARVLLSGLPPRGH
jgi:hypothetical protein